MNARLSQRITCRAPYFLALLSVVSAAQNGLVTEAATSRYLEAAQQAERTHDYARASGQYQEILKLQPNLALIRQSLAVTYHLQNRFPEAIQEFQHALRLDPKLWGSDLFLGMDYYKTNQFASAIAPLELSISLNAKMAEPEARFWLAAAHSALGKPETAVRDLRRDLVLRPGDIDVLYQLTKAYDQAAAATFQRLGTVEPKAAAVALLQAESQLEENRQDLARVQYRNALQLRPDFTGWLPSLTGGNADSGLMISAGDARSNLELADLFMAIGGQAQAIAILDSLAKQKPASTKAHDLIAAGGAKLAAIQNNTPHTPLANAKDISQGIALVQQGRFREAEEPLLRAAPSVSNLALQIFLMRAYIEAGDCQPAEDRLQQLLTAEPDNVDALHLLGRNYKRQAEATLQQMMAQDANAYGVHELLGKQHEEKTEYDLAIAEYQAALAKRPDTAGIRYEIGNVYRKMSRYDKAETWLKEELARNPYHGLAHYRLGSIYVEQGKADAGIVHLLQAVQSHPQLTDAKLDLGRAYTAKARYQDAISILKQVSAASPDNDRVHYLLSLAFAKEGRREQAQTELAVYQRLTRDRLERTQLDIKNVSKSVDQ